MSTLIVVAGPTASGKTDVALEMSRLLPMEAVSCDSMQIYRDMPVLTQSVSPEVQKVLPTHLVSFLKPEEEYNASLFRSSAEALIRQISAKKKIPAVVGGTGLYLRALLDGLFENPDGKPMKDEVLRKELYEMAEREGAEKLHEKLKECDPVSAKKIHANDVRRVVRALEVYRLTGVPLSAQKSNRSGIRNEYETHLFFLDRDRPDLYARIDERVEQMFASGLIEEVKALEGRKLSHTAEMALGIREVRAYLKGEHTLSEAKELLKKNTRNYAKRQVSWFRHEEGMQFVAVGKTEPSKSIAKRLLERAGLS